MGSTSQPPAAIQADRRKPRDPFGHVFKVHTDPNGQPVNKVPMPLPPGCFCSNFLRKQNVV
jgi:hypothetical protein